MILYHPTKDIYHTQYRIISILLSTKELPKEKLRLLDFYYNFPHFISEIQPWPSDIKEYKIKKGAIPEPFEKISNKKRVFFQMTEVFNTAVGLLVAKDIVKVSGENRNISLKQENIPSQLIHEISEDLFIKTSAFKTIVSGLAKTNWSGPQGLKKRSGLLEFKYDE
ncbi:ABC-three component system middle component 5 [Ferrimonas aestuarii]|uniref:Uncharacterized protein n=1 Tax=Ferrimonas aestuarii TaxID=2569539 RepID=A0A4U1BKH8_9GAMM|nr:ABC-three component system middle component 5 [Ferrimonas aestuarii]TKB52019.1 hypothetical protein FCL42_16510 [Ferrimonas aestuarii]